MKTFIRIISITIFWEIVFVSPAFTQFVITSSYLPVIGDTLRTSEVDTTGLTPGESGTNQVWNFSNINILPGTPFEEVYLIPFLTPYVSQFPNANLASKNNNPNPDYHYYQNTTEDWNMIGYATSGFMKWFTTPSCRFHYPVSYGSQFNSTYHAYNYSGQATVYTTGFKTFNVDGHGTIILPTVTYNNVMRVKVIDESYDTIKVGGVVTSTAHTIITNYWWFSMGYKFPVLDLGFVESIINSFKFAYVPIKNVPVYVNQISSKIPEKFDLFQNYPNPFNPSTKIRFSIGPPLNPLLKAGLRNERIAILRIYDILGKEVATLINEQLSAGIYEVEWNAENYPSGIYFYKLTTERFSQTKRMELIK
jgi:hypothetical protein